MILYKKKSARRFCQPIKILFFYKNKFMVYLIMNWYVPRRRAICFYWTVFTAFYFFIFCYTIYQVVFRFWYKIQVSGRYEL